VLRHLSGGGVVVLEQKKVSVGACVAKHHVRITHKEKLSSNSDFQLVFLTRTVFFTHSKIANNTFSHIFSTKQTGSMREFGRFFIRNVLDSIFFEENLRTHISDSDS
jgi:hypothetical protein